MIPQYFIDNFQRKNKITSIDAEGTIEQKENRFNVLGSGHFSVVYEHPEDVSRVIKVSCKSDDGGVLYAFWCRQSHIKKMKGIPEIHEIVQRKCDATVLTFIEMKRYQCTLNNYFNENLYKSDSFNDDIYDTYANVTNILYGTEPYNTIGNEYFETSKLIREFFKGSIGFDLHNENVMIDENDELIITDPVSFIQSGSKIKFDENDEVVETYNNSKLFYNKLFIEKELNSSINNKIMDNTHHKECKQILRELKKVLDSIKVNTSPKILKNI